MTPASQLGMVSSGKQKARGLSIGVKIAAGYGVALVAFLLIGTVSYRNIAQLNEDAFWVRHTLQVQKKLQDISLEMVEASSNARAYALTGDLSCVENVKRLEPEIRQDHQELRSLTSDNPGEQKNLDALDTLIARRFYVIDRFDQLIADRQAGRKFDASEAVSLVRSGQSEMDGFHQIVDAMQAEEQRLLQERETKAGAASELTSATIVWGTLASFLLVLVAALWITRGILASLRRLNDAATRIGEGNYSYRVEDIGGDEVGQLALVFNRMAAQVEQRQADLAEQEWLKGSLARFSSLFQGQRDLAAVCRDLVSEIAEVLAVRHAVVYLAESEAESPGFASRPVTPPGIHRPPSPRARD